MFRRHILNQKIKTLCVFVGNRYIKYLTGYASRVTRVRYCFNNGRSLRHYHKFQLKTLLTVNKQPRKFILLLLVYSIIKVFIMGNVGLFVQGLGREIFILETGVRFSYRLQEFLQLSRQSTTLLMLESRVRVPLGTQLIKIIIL